MHLFAGYLCVMTSMDFDNPIRLARIRVGMNRRELARLAHIDRSTLSDLEAGQTETPTMATLEALAPHLRLPAQTLADAYEMWRSHPRKPRLSAKANAVLALPASAIADFGTFREWRRAIEPIPRRFALLLDVSPQTVQRYERGIRQNGMPELIQRAIVARLGVDTNYLAELVKLEPDTVKD